jgi:predicted adenylyl cyclase CyaB
MTVALEREVKFRLSSWEEGERRLLEAGARLLEARYFEQNSLLDFPQGVLERRGEALRLRRARGRAWLAYKGPVHGRGRIKKRKEYETALDDAQAMEEILRSIGLVECFQYEKYRAVYRIDGLEVSLDEAPMGYYLELEGSLEEIDAVVQKMGFCIEDAITLTYPRLYQLHRDEAPQAPEYMIFPGDNRPR